MQATHSTNALLLPSSERDLYRLTPTVMPNIAGCCNWCGRTPDQIGLETLGEYLIATAFDGETVRFEICGPERSSIDLRLSCSRLRMQDCRNPEVAWEPWRTSE